ncbi:MAG: fluoride efflux transporter CrcB [Dissulfurispiraceae bacterium]|jgi:CrcB protein|nr:fluoride efflux transporter CrcB [Dissulfurispiraceae bacterium]
MLRTYLYVGAGGFLGAIARYALSSWIGQWWGRSFPLGTFVVNISGCFFIGAVMTLLTERMLINPQLRSFMCIGFLGAYTTFSAFEYETSKLLKDGEQLIAVLNIFLSIVVGFIALKVGEALAKAI